MPRFSLSAFSTICTTGFRAQSHIDAAASFFVTQEGAGPAGPVSNTQWMLMAVLFLRIVQVGPSGGLRS